MQDLDRHAQQHSNRLWRCLLQHSSLFLTDEVSYIESYLFKAVPSKKSNPFLMIPYENSAYSGNSVAAFALFKFVQSVGAAVAFLYSTALNLHHQLYILAVIASMATLSFCFVDWSCRSKLASGIEKSDSQQDIVKRNQVHDGALSKGKRLDSGDGGIYVN